MYFVIYKNFQFSAPSARKDTLPTPGMASADSADDEFWKTSPEMSLKNFLWNGLKETNKKYSEIALKTD